MNKKPTSYDECINFLLYDKNQRNHLSIEMIEEELDFWLYKSNDGDGMDMEEAIENVLSEFGVVL